MMSRRAWIVRIVISSIVLVLVAGRAEANAVVEPHAVTDDDIRRVMSLIVEELQRLEAPRTGWDPAVWSATNDGDEHQAGGYTALAVLAQLMAGVSYQDPALGRAIERLRALPMTGTYAISLRTMIWARLPPKFQHELERDAAWLLEAFDRRRGGWAYTSPSRNRRYDNSIRQFGALALWEAARRGIEIDDDVWKRVESAFLEGQLKTGAWDYKGEGEARGSMTCAGLATLFITEDLLHAQESVRLGRTRTTPRRAAMDLGLDWLSTNFSPYETPGRPGYYYFYYAWSVERVGLASGRRTFGGQDWLRIISAEIINRLCGRDADGDLVLRARSGERPTTVVRELSFALMFLARGRTPLALCKLELPDARWNNRPRDVAHLVDELGQKTERELNWQIVGLNDPLELWLSAPAVYLASNEPLPWLDGISDDQLDDGTRRELIEATPALRRMRTYLDRGGVLLALAEGRGRRFSESIERLGTLLYPSRKWRDLPDDHWAYTQYLPVDKKRPKLRALSNGVRELIILAPRGDLPAACQGMHDNRATQRSTLMNLCLYASEVGRYPARLARPKPGDLGADAPRIRLVHASYDGEWIPEPAALRQFSTWLAATHGVHAETEVLPLSDIATHEPRPDLVFVTGCDPHTLTRGERDAVISAARSGMTILFETVGGTGEFAIEAEAALTAELGGTARSLIRHPVVTGVGVSGGTSLEQVSYRPYTFDVWGTRERTPRLRGHRVEDEGAARILYSREDLSFGLLDRPRWGIVGYEPDSARQILAQIVLWTVSMRADRP